MTTFTGDEYGGPELQIGKYRLRSNLTNSKIHISLMDGDRFVEAGQFSAKQLEAVIDQFYKEKF